MFSKKIYIFFNLNFQVKEPVCGYLAGQWDLNSHNLAVTHSFPCLTRNADEAARIESEIYSQIYNFLKMKNIFSKKIYIFKFSGKGTSMRLLSRTMGSQFTQFSSHSFFSLFNSKC